MAVIGDVFGLNTVYDRQVENVTNSNFASWPESGLYGYFGGGETPTTTCVINRLDFSTEILSGPNNNLSTARDYLAATSSGSYGYFGGGRLPPSTTYSTIDRLDFSTETVSTPLGKLSLQVYDSAATSSSSYGYFGSGGVLPGVTRISIIDRLDFSSEVVTTLTSKLNPKNGLAATSSSSYGYFGGGDTPTTASSLIERLDFTSETVALPNINLPQARFGLAATSSSSYGYFGGGANPGIISKIDRLDYVNETISTPVNFPVARRSSAAVSSSSYGYFGGGFTPTVICTITRLDFSNETVSDPGNNLPTATHRLAAVSGGASVLRGNKTYGYLGSTVQTQKINFSNETNSVLNIALGENTATASNYYGYFIKDLEISSNIDRLDFFSETKLNSIANLTRVSYYNLDSTASSSYGYFCNGVFIGPPSYSYYSTTIDRLDFFNETISNPPQNLLASRDGSIGASSSLYGYFAGGASPPSPAAVCSIQRLDFSNETIAYSPANLPQARTLLAQTSNNSYAYFAGGYINGIRQSIIDRLDFSNETTSNPPLFLSQARGVFAGVSNNNYGYLCGGNIEGPPLTPTIVATKTIYRINFSNETISTIPPLLNDTSTTAAVSNSN